MSIWQSLRFLYVYDIKSYLGLIHLWTLTDIVVYGQFCFIISKTIDYFVKICYNVFTDSSTLLFTTSRKKEWWFIMVFFEIFHKILTIILIIISIALKYYCKKHNIDPTKFTIVTEIGTLCLIAIQTIVFIVFNYSVLITQLPYI